MWTCVVLFNNLPKMQEQKVHYIMISEAPKKAVYHSDKYANIFKNKKL